jgi:hypothetical protein
MQRIENGALRFARAARAIGVLDAKDELSAVLFGETIVD